MSPKPAVDNRSDLLLDLKGAEGGDRRCSPPTRNLAGCERGGHRRGCVCRSAERYRLPRDHLAQVGAHLRRALRRRSVEPGRTGRSVTARLISGYENLMRRALYATLALLTACATPRPPADVQVPLFARIPYQPFSRDAVVAIALREWRLFGSAVDDDPPESYRPATPDDKPERQQGLCSASAINWWLAMNAARRKPHGPANTTRPAPCFRRARMAHTPGRPPSCCT